MRVKHHVNPEDNCGTVLAMAFDQSEQVFRVLVKGDDGRLHTFPSDYLTVIPEGSETVPINIVLTRPPGPHSDFVEVETDDGRGVCVGEWVSRPDGLHALRIATLPMPERP